MGLRDVFREFARGLSDSMKPALAPETPAAECSPTDNSPAAHALRTAEDLQAQAESFPEGSSARVTLVQLAEELRVYAAGQKAKDALAEHLSDPIIQRILKNANIKID